MRSTVGIPRDSSISRIISPIIADSVDSLEETTTGADPDAAHTGAQASSKTVQMRAPNLTNRFS
jgi:hypothetical protein